MTDSVESKSRVLNALCTDLVKNKLKVPDIKLYDELCAAISAKMESAINKNISTVDVKTVLNTYRRKLANRGFVGYAQGNFGNFRPQVLPLLNFQVKTESLCCIESLFDKSTNSMNLMLYVCIPEQFFYKSDIINYRLIQKLNFALLVVIDVLKGLDFMSPVDNWNLFSFDHSPIHATLFSHCYVNVNVKSKHITNNETPITMKVTCVPENVDFFEIDRLRFDNNCVRIQYLRSKEEGEKSEKEAGFESKEAHLPSVAYNQMMINCLSRHNINKQLLQKFHNLPLIYKECLALVCYAVGVKNLGQIDNEYILSCFFKFTASGALTEKGLNYEGHVFEAFTDFCKLFYKLLNENDSIYRTRDMCIQSHVCENLDIFHNLSLVNFDLVKLKFGNLVKSFGSVPERALYTELFENKLSMFSEYDLLCSFNINAWYINSVQPEDLLEFNCRAVDLVVSKLMPELSASLGKRAVRIDLLNITAEEVDKDADENDARVYFGVKLNFSMQAEAVIKGPLPENAQEAEKFRQLWGDDLCKLRRFKDGTICYAVAFPDFIQSKLSLRDVSKTILKHITLRHLGEDYVDSFQVVSNILERGLTSKVIGVGHFTGTGEEEIQSTRNKVERFESLMFDISKQLPLRIQSVTCLNDEVNRNSSIIPASCETRRDKCVYEVVHKKVRVPSQFEHLFASGNNSRRLIELQLVLQTHQSWPSKNHEAVKRLKAAFYSKMGQLLTNNESSLVAFPTFDGLYVQSEGQVYRLTIFHPPEVKMLMRQMRTPTGAIHWAHTEDSKKLEMDQILKPKLRVLFAGFEQFFPQFGPICRLVKAWVNAHLLLFEIGDLVVELLVAAMLENGHLNGAVPGSMQAGLFKFWCFISTFNFAVSLIRLGLQDPNTLTTREASEQEKCAELKFDLDRVEFPPLTIFTPVTPMTSDFTSHVSQPVLNRLAKLSAKALKVVHTDMMLSLNGRKEFPNVATIFEPNFASFDLIVQVVAPEKDEKNGPKAKKQKKNETDVSESDESESDDDDANDQMHKKSRKMIPVFNVNLVEMVAKRLKACVGHLAHVFCDIHSESADKVALKFKKSQFPEVNDWFSANLALIVGEIETVVGINLIVDMQLLYKDV